MNYRMAILFVTVTAFVGLATAQSSKVGPPSGTSAKDPLKTANKPLTPKSPIQSHGKSSSPLPNASKDSQKANAELTRLERQSVRTPAGAKGGNAAPAKSAPVKVASPPSGSGSGINSTYQKPHSP